MLTKELDPSPVGKFEMSCAFRPLESVQAEIITHEGSCCWPAVIRNTERKYWTGREEDQSASGPKKP